MCPRCRFKEIIPSLEVKYAITRHPFRAHSLQFIYAFGRTTFIELAVYLHACI